MLVQKTVTTNTNFAGRLYDAMLRKTPCNSKRWSGKNAGILSIREEKKLHPRWERTFFDCLWALATS